MHTVVIPAAGLGTRLYPRTRTVAKELLELAGVPVIWAALLEAEAAGAQEVVVVVSPSKRAVGQWVRDHAPATLRVRVAIQPEPAGVVDAVRRAEVRGRFAVLYPDYVALPQQRALAHLAQAAQSRPEATWYGLFRTTPETLARVGRTARVHVQPEAGGHRITGLATEETGWRTTFAELRGARHNALLQQGPADDHRVLEVLHRLATENQLFGSLLPGPVLDLGVMPGLLHAEQSFLTKTAHWRITPTRP
jgi:hypothetical protein